MEKIEINELPPEEIEVKEVYVKEIKTVEIQKNIKGLNGKDGKDGKDGFGKNGKDGKDGKTPTKTELKALIKEVFPEDKLLEKLIKRMPKEEVQSIEIGEDRGGKFIKKDGKKMYLTSGIGPVMSTGVHDFLHLTDAPSSYAGQGGKVVKVKVDETGLEFGTGGGGGSVFVNGVEVTDPNFEDTAEIAITTSGSDVNFAIKNGSIDETKLDTSVNTSLDLADTAVQPAGLAPYELLANKSTSTSLGTSDTLYPSQNAVKTYVDNSVVGLLDDRGNYDASGNVFPSTGGSGTAGAILKGDLWIISVAGTLGGSAVEMGDQVRALVDTPGQTAGNWAISQANIGYVPENVANKVTSLSGASTDTEYPSAKLTYDQLALKVTANGAITGATKTKITYDTKGLVTAGADATTADIADSTNKRYVTDADLTDIGNLSGTNTGDQTITNSSDATSHTVTLSASGGSLQLIEGTNITLTTGGTGSAGTVTIAASGGSGATTALDNLASVAINTSLISDTDNTDNLGTSLIRWATGYFVNLGATATRIVQGWFTDLTVTNPISGSVTGNAGTATALQTARTIGTLTGDVTSTGSSFDGTGNNTNSTTIANSAVTLAKMANLAQDQFIGRTTASTGVPETATITAAARTVLDDTTVAAMVDTLGGATSTGTGGLVRATSPTLVTPALGTPASGVMTNVTGTATGLTSGITNALKSATTTVDVSAATAPSSGQVLTATSSTAATWQTPTGGAPKTKFSTTFEDIARFTTGTDGTGATPAIGTTGLTLRTSTNGAAKIIWDVGTREYQQMSSLQMSMRANSADTGNSTGKGDFFFGLGNFAMTIAAAGITFTNKHIGVKIIKNLSDTYDIIGTQADGTTEAVTSTIATMASSQFVDIIIDVTSTTNTNFYVSVNYGAYATASLGSTNRPTGDRGFPIYAVSSHGNNSSQRYGWDIYGASFEY